MSEPVATQAEAVTRPALTAPEIEAHTWDAVRKTINKFREQPYYFFTESDVISYLWMCLYSRKLEFPTRDGRPIYGVHREYPTNFRYDKPRLLEMDVPYPLTDRLGTRGNFDLAVLSPEFVGRAPGIEHIVNKNVRDLESRHDPAAEELLFAIECKYVISSSGEWEHQIRRDNKKLEFAKRCNVRNVVNLVFCNTRPAYLERFQAAVREADPAVCCVFIQSYYDEGAVKHTPPPLANTAGALRSIGSGRADTGVTAPAVDPLPVA